ncbi:MULTISPECIES: low temperature requirement protein A [Micromonospora]|uniref:low temperature requirement protein A n=1 Tax=Micromonospora TaxID=1873 RepID=UPI00131A3021|nr:MULTISPECIES: low temperature requirement protein A [Micromonospora]NES14056.1 low temperature requirement protein A [Micromonospora sp. PPF5-17B]NES35686.1 low temperature requirement protein A [Micromonospora solifontis]NES56067.1 low temperature requirement protein A [Micromonospora sp. PPF5-6]
MGDVGRIQLAGDEGGVSRLELFLDLIFVFAFLNVTGVTAEQLNPAGLPRGLLLLVLLWWCWAPFAWLGNSVRLDRGVMPVVMFGLSATLFVMALTVREAFLDRPGGLPGPVVFALGYLAVRATVLAVGTLAGTGGQSRHLFRQALPPVLVGTLFLLAAAVLPNWVEDPVAREWIRYALVACTVLVEYGAALLIGSNLWRIGSSRYWAERHGLIILIGFGETIISVGLSQGAAIAQPLTPVVLVGVLLGVALAGALWWTYFDVARFAGEQALERVSGDRRSRLGRDAYSLLHLPMMAGLILVALGLKKVLGELRVHTGSETTTPGFGRLVLYGGVALYLLGLLLFEIRALRLLGRSPVLGLLLVAVLAPLAPHLPVLIQLALLTAAAGAMALADVTVFRARHRRLHAQIAPAHRHAGVTPKELFFDLVFVYAFLQVAALMSDDPTWTGVVRGLLVLTILWLAWCGYAWLAAVVRSESPVVRLVMVLVVALTALIALASPQAFTGALGGLPGPLVFVACYAAIRLLHLASFGLMAWQDPCWRRPPVATALPTLIALALLLAAALMPTPVTDLHHLTPVQVGLWLLAIAVDFGGNARISLRHLRIGSAEHWTDRHCLIIIIGLGEAVISMGSAVVYTPISARIVVAAFLGTALLASLWWVYFGWGSVAEERVLATARGERRTRLARDAYTWLHLPMVAGIVLVSLGLRKTISVLGSRGFFELGPPPYPLGHLALFGGVLLYLLGDLAFRRRLTGRYPPARVVRALVVAALLPLTGSLAALLALALLAAVCLAFTAFEVIRGHGPARTGPVTAH